jgi:hypothetical protein
MSQGAVIMEVRWKLSFVVREGSKGVAQEAQRDTAGQIRQESRAGQEDTILVST